MNEQIQSFLDKLQNTPYVGQGYTNLLKRYGDYYNRVMQRHFEALNRYTEGDAKRFEKATDAFFELTFETLRLQSKYFSSGVFSLPPEQREEVHKNDELMEGTYLLGLFLAAIFWENHFEKMNYFEETVPSLLPANAKVLDIGAGSGLFTSIALLNRPDIEIVAVDISPVSERLINELHLEAAPPDTPVTFKTGSFPDISNDVGNKYDAIFFSDVVEHLPDPEAGMAAVKELLNSEGFVFFATATNAAFFDHTIVFSDVAEIENLLARHSFSPERSMQVPVLTNKDGQRVIDYFAILRLMDT